VINGEILICLDICDLLTGLVQDFDGNIVTISGLIYISVTVTEVLLNLTEVLLTLTEVYPCFFLSCKANARIKLAKTGHGPQSTILVQVCICVVRLLFMLFYVVFVCKCVLPPGDNQIAINKYIISYIK
jgi:hypothetical protein